MYRFLGALLVTVCAASLATADFWVLVTGVEDGKVTFKKGSKKGKTGELGPEETLPLAENAKVFRGKINVKAKQVEPTDALTKDAVKEHLAKWPKGAFAQIFTDADGKHITELRFVDLKKKEK